jgi:Bacterial Ig-like domain (group 2)
LIEVWEPNTFAPLSDGDCVSHLHASTLDRSCLMRAHAVVALAFLPGVVACGNDVTAGGREILAPVSSQVASVAVTPLTALVSVGDTVRLVAATRDASGSPLPGRVVAWSSENPALATVSATGLVTALVGGRSVRITALSEGVSGGATITIN